MQNFPPDYLKSISSKIGKEIDSINLFEPIVKKTPGGPINPVITKEVISKGEE